MKNDVSISTIIDKEERIGVSYCVKCPICNGLYTHVAEDKDKQVTVYESPDCWDGRGDVTALNMSCEEGHQFQLCLGFHKGYTFMFVRLYEKI